MISLLYNYEIALLFAGGLFAWFLSATIESIKNIKRNHKTVPHNKKGPGISSFILPNLRQTLVDTGIQPLLIIAFINLLDKPHALNILGVVCLVMFIMFHEFYLSKKYSGKLLYQMIVASIWIGYFLLTSYLANK